MCWKKTDLSKARRFSLEILQVGLSFVLTARDSNALGRLVVRGVFARSLPGVLKASTTSLEQVSTDAENAKVRTDN